MDNRSPSPPGLERSDLVGTSASKYIAAGIREVVQEDFRQPIEKAVEGPIRSIEVAAYHARGSVGHLKEEARFQTWTIFALILALGFGLGSFGDVLLLYPSGVGVEQPFRPL